MASARRHSLACAGNKGRGAGLAISRRRTERSTCKARQMNPVPVTAPCSTASISRPTLEPAQSAGRQSLTPEAKEHAELRPPDGYAVRAFNDASACASCTSGSTTAASACRTRTPPNDAGSGFYTGITRGAYRRDGERAAPSVKHGATGHGGQHAIRLAGLRAGPA